MRKVVDWRAPNLRMEGFARYYYWRVKNNDLDHGHWVKHCAKGMSIEQRLWLSHLFGQTYSVPMAYAFYQTFPDVYSIDRDELEQWNTDNWKRCKYGTDTKYNKGHFAKMVNSYLDWLGDDTQENKLRPLVQSGNFNENFLKIYKESLGWFKFGRMAAWIYSQTMKDLIPEFEIKPMTMFVEDSSNWSVWNGTMFVHNKEERIVGKKYDYKPTKDHRKESVDMVIEIYEYIENEFDIDPDMFLIESALCQYKKMHQCRDYPGHTTGDFMGRGILFENELFPELDWTNYREANRSCPDITRYKLEMKADNEYFGNTGKFMYLHTEFDDMEIVTSTVTDKSKLYSEEKYW